MKRKTQKIVKGRERPKLDRAEVERLVRELARPERLAREAQSLLRRLRDDPALAAIRFDHAALVKAAGEAASLEAVVDALVDDDARAAARSVLERRAKEGGELEEMLPYRVGMHLLEAERERGQAASKNPFWLGVALATAHDLPVAAYLRERPLDEVAREAEEGRAAAGFRAFLDSDARAAAVRKLVPQMDLEAVLIHALIGLGEAVEIALPLEAALAGPIEAARAARRRSALAGIGSAAPAATEQAKTLIAAIEKDASRAIAAYRREILARFREAAANACGAEVQRAAAGRVRLRPLFAMLVALEALPPTKNIPLIAAYEAAGSRAIAEADDREKPLLHAILGRPLAVEGYRAYAAALLEKGDAARARAFAEAALAHFPGDEALQSVARRAADAPGAQG